MARSLSVPDSRASRGEPQAVTSATSAPVNRRITAICWQPPPEISVLKEWTAAPLSSPNSPARSQAAASCTSLMARTRLPPAKTTPRDSQASIMASTSDSRAPIGLSVETPRTPASALAVTASWMNLAGRTTAARSGVMRR